MDPWNINSASNNNNNNSNKVSAGKLMLSMRNDGAFFYPRSSITGLEDHHSSASAAVRENLLQYGSFEGSSDQESADVEVSDHEAQQLHPAEKKRRLSVEQVRSLERNFEMENKLEPERKKQLAHELGLQPRQVAVWFQNRRARWKTKQLERDFEALRTSYDALLVENKKLQAEVTSLVAKLEAKSPSGATVDQKIEMLVVETKEEVDIVLTGKVGKVNGMGEDMEVSNCKAINKEGSPCSDGYTSEILDAEYQAEAVPVVEENVLPFEQHGVLMDSPAKVVIKDHHQPDGMVYDAHTNQLVLYRYEDYCNHEFDNSYFSADGISPWWT